MLNNCKIHNDIIKIITVIYFDVINKTKIYKKIKLW